jgi:ribosomal protein L11 methyltransferase
MAEAGLAFDVAREEARDWVAEAAALQKSVVVGSYLLDPHEGERATPAEGRTRLHVPAERAFGTGSHESTRLALRLLLEAPLAGARVLAVGCGAGTLAFVAALEGAARAVAFDIDPDAAFATRAGARRNGTARVAPFAGPTEALSADAPFDVVVANMIAEELAPLLPEIARRMRAGALLVTSGQLAERRDEWDGVLRRAGFEPERELTEGEWIGWSARRSA